MMSQLNVVKRFLEIFHQSMFTHLDELRAHKAHLSDRARNQACNPHIFLRIEHLDVKRKQKE